MSTNYYHRRVDEVAGDFDVTHIGLSSGGRRFLFRAYPEAGICTFADWKARLAEPSSQVFDEYDRPVDTASFMALVQAKQVDVMVERTTEMANRNAPIGEGKSWMDSEGFSFANYEFS